MQSTAAGASALRAIGISAKNTGLNSGCEVSRVVRGHPRKHAMAWIRGREEDGSRDSIIDEQLGMAVLHARQFMGNFLALCGGEHLVAAFAFLRCVEARPDPHNFAAGRPE